MKKLCLFIFLCNLFACNPHSEYYPKPTAYPRIDIPKAHVYKTWRPGECPFTFRYSAFGSVAADSERGSEKCWFNVLYKDFNATIHLSYKDVSDRKNFDEMSEDARTFAYKHSIKAEDISDSVFHLPGNIHGILYKISGNTASSIQFYATDSARHYLRGSLYFYTRPNKDSLEPVINFIRTDIDTMIRSLMWK